MTFLRRRMSASIVRPLRADRAEECAGLHARAFAHPWSAAEIETLIRAPSSVCFAALDSVTGRLRGFAISRLAADEAEVLTIAVDPASRRRGLGRDLLRALIDSLALSGATTLFLEVDAANAAALSLYSRFQFVKVGERIGYYRRPNGEPATAHVMRRFLA
jgi:ribosomal-protein-alanine N-acetyltransferase